MEKSLHRGGKVSLRSVAPRAGKPYPRLSAPKACASRVIPLSLPLLPSFFARMAGLHMQPIFKGEKS